MYLVISVLYDIDFIFKVPLKILHHLKNKIHVSRVIRKLTFCICENKDADQLRGNKDVDQLRGNHEADQRLCFRYIDSTIPLLSKSEISSLFCSCTAWFVSDQVGNQNIGFLMTWLMCVNKT